MRRSREEAARTHARIVERAAMLFRERGIDGIGLAALMHEAGLTHGGFYKHFDSKDGLAAEACAHGLAQSAQRMRRRAEKNPAEPLAAVIEGFLSAEHVEDAGRGCTVAALGSDMFRCPEAIRSAFTAGVAELIDIMTELQPEGSLAARRESAMTTFAAMLGAVVLARGVNDPKLRRALIESMRGRLLPAAEKKGKRHGG
jgi:TetR/AcrR family transcriptional regulator, transcriptional repressor for nem operon